jgi:hypothetical protein
MTASQDMIRGRSNIVTLTNNSGGALVAGDVCVQDATGEEYVTTTTSAASVLKVVIAAEPIGIGATGRFYESGYCPLVTPNASVTRGRFLFTHTVAKQAAESATYAAGAFGKILKSGTTPSAIIYSATAQTSGGGSGNVTFEAAYASPPTPASGDLWYISDSMLHARYTGAAWSYYFGTRKVTKPIVGDFSTWYNQGAGTLTDKGQLILYAPGTNSDNFRGVTKTAPSLNYQIDAIIIPGVQNSTTFGASIGWADGTKSIQFGIGNANGTYCLELIKWNTTTSFNAVYTTANRSPFTNSYAGLPIWLRVTEDGTNRTCYYSLDQGNTYIQFHQVGRTDFLTATQVGFFAYAISATLPASNVLLSWAQS